MKLEEAREIVGDCQKLHPDYQEAVALCIEDDKQKDDTDETVEEKLDDIEEKLDEVLDDDN